MNQNKLTFAMIGSGRVATHLAPALNNSGMICQGVYSPTYQNAQTLAQKIGCPALKSLEEVVSLSVDFVLLSIKDDALEGVAAQFPADYPHPLIHTSGSTPLEVLKSVPHYGVLYPMQTFSKERTLDIQEVPFFIEANDDDTLQLLHILIQKMGVKVSHPLSSEGRGRLHLASVFACNFTNHLYAVADEVLGDLGLELKVLEPLMKETMEKALTHPPKEVQTGPAIRGDEQTMQRHLNLLEQKPELHKLYKMLSDSIQNQK